jgi:hypothetical protein
MTHLGAENDDGFAATHQAGAPRQKNPPTFQLLTLIRRRA